METKTMETNKKEQYSALSIKKQMDSYLLRCDHPAQRESGQWSVKMQSNLVSDILQGNPVPALIFAEQIINGVSIIWNIDGKQRCTTVSSYLNDGFKVSKSVRRCMIPYKSQVKDENGKIVLDKDGIPMFENKEFNITNKKFSQLPESLQEKFKDYCFDVVKYLNCTSEEIMYHIERYNDGKPMNNNQKGIIRLGEKNVQFVKDIAKMDFFTDCGNYTLKEDSNGTINRVVAETVMATNFMNDWKKNQEDMCKYLSENATDDMFIELKDSISNLEEIVTDNHESLFNSKDSFIWFTVYQRAKGKVEDDTFAEFLDKFVDELHSKEVNGTTFDELKNNRSTKDKSVIMKKIECIEVLLGEFLENI